MRDCFSGPWTTNFSRQGDLQKTWKQGSSFGSLKLSRQIEHSSLESIFLTASSAIVGSSAIVVAPDK